MTLVKYAVEVTEDFLIKKSGELHDSLMEWADELGPSIGDISTKVVYVTAKNAPPAWFLPSKRRLHINAAQIDVIERPDVVVGAMLHEVAHAMYSSEHLFGGWGTDAKSRDMAVVFEEVRIETILCEKIDTQSIRPMHAWLFEEMLKGEIPTKGLELSRLWALIYGRAVAGVYRCAESDNFDSVVRAALGDVKVDLMIEILEEAVSVDFELSEHDATQKMIDLGEEWVKLFEDEEDEDEESEGGDEEEDSSSVSVGGVVVCDHGPGEDDALALPDEVYIDGSYGDFSSVDGPANTDPEESVERSELEDLLAQTIKDLIDAISKPFVSVPDSGVTTGNPQEELTKMRRGRTGRESAPRPQLRNSANQLADALRRMALPSVSRTRVAQEAPPGRLSGRGALQRSADRAAGRISTARPWRGMRKTVAVSKPIRIGCMTDTSGSMYWAETMVAEFAWAVAKASGSVGALSAALTYGDHVTAVTLPREYPQGVRRHPANGGTEVFDQAAASMEALLHLGAYDGASKVLFNVSDGHYVIRDEYLRARKWLEQWTKAGTTVVWVGCAPSKKTYYEMPGVVFVESSTEVEDLISDLIKALRKIR